MAIDMYRVHEQDQRAERHAAYVADAKFSTIEAEALQRGYRHATLSEINASADRSAGWAPDLFCWRGGLWVEMASDTLKAQP